MTDLRTTIDLPHIARFTVGMDRLFQELNRTVDANSNGYPPYNIVAVNDAQSGEPLRWEVELAVAGFRKEDLTVTLDRNQLIIEGNIEDKEPRNYMHRGISARRFVRTFTLADHVELREARVDNGLLVVTLERVIPEELKPRLIPITVTA